jgi:hypothetical protein
VGLTAKETRQFSVLRAVRAMVEGDWTKAGFEREVSQAIEQKATAAGLQRAGTGKGFFIPLEVQQRDMLVATAANGGNMVATTLRPQDFIGLLRNRMLSAQLGIRFLPNHAISPSTDCLKPQTPHNSPTPPPPPSA